MDSQDLRHFLRSRENSAAFAGCRVAGRLRRCLDRSPFRLARGCGEEVVQRMAKVRAAAKKVSCEDCYFKCNLLCALDLDEPCATFRPDHPDGLRPPRQLRFHFRQERRTQAAWAFPTAQEQAALHR